MSKVCDVCGKRPMSGNRISHAHNLSRRRWKPNVRKMRVEWKGNTKSISVCARCYRSGRVSKVNG